MTTAKRKKEDNDTPKIVHPEPEVIQCFGTEENGRSRALTVDDAKKLLGWQTEADATQEAGTEVKFGKDYLFIDRNGDKVRCLKNGHNRPFDGAHCLKVMQDTLNRRFILNGETIIIGCYGNVLSGQHRLVGLVWSDQERQKEADAPHWADLWGEEPTSIETIVVRGISEDKATIRTLDNTKPRVPSDVFFSEGEFAGTNVVARVEMCKIQGKALTVLWNRTGAKNDTYRSHLTNSEATEFADAHRWLAECVRHVYQEDKGKVGKGGRIARYIALGHAAAYMYLMGAGATDGADYRAGNPPSEEHVTFKFKQKARDFWTTLAKSADGAGDPEDSFYQLRYARRPGMSKSDAAAYYFDQGIHRGTVPERSLLLTLAWYAFLEGKALTEKDLITKDFYVTKDGATSLVVPPGKPKDYGGIDLGPGGRVPAGEGKEDEDGEEEEPEVKETPEETAARIKEEKREKRIKEIKEADERRKARKGILAYEPPKEGANPPAEGGKSADEGAQASPPRAKRKADVDGQPAPATP